jgi:hypothetical protein
LTALPVTEDGRTYEELLRGIVAIDAEDALYEDAIDGWYCCASGRLADVTPPNDIAPMVPVGAICGLGVSSGAVGAPCTIVGVVGAFCAAISEDAGYDTVGGIAPWCPLSRAANAAAVIAGGGAPPRRAVFGGLGYSEASVATPLGMRLVAPVRRCGAGVGMPAPRWLAPIICMRVGAPTVLLWCGSCHPIAPLAVSTIGGGTADAPAAGVATGSISTRALECAREGTHATPPRAEKSTSRIDSGRLTKEITFNTSTYREMWTHVNSK